MGGIKRKQFGRRSRNVIRCGILKLWERNEKVLKDSGEDLSCLVLRQRKRILVD
jgi:hypothetical protein